MRHRRPTSALLAAGAMVVALAAGCGVRPSGVITGGPAPRGPVASGVRLYFVSEGNPTRVLRGGLKGAPDEVLTLLSAGPNENERDQGLTTAIPDEAWPMSALVTDVGATVKVASNVDELPSVAVDQIVCTVAASDTGTRQPDQSTMVTLVSDGRTLETQGCPLP